MKLYSSNFSVGLSLSALVLVISYVLFIGNVHAQATAVTINQQGQSEFKHDVERGTQEVKNDTGAQNNQQEIDTDDSEHAGDEYADVKEIDGENNQSEIDNEIEQEVEQEDATSGQSSDQENGRASSSTENGSSSGDTGN